MINVFVVANVSENVTVVDFVKMGQNGEFGSKWLNIRLFA